MTTDRMVISSPKVPKSSKPIVILIKKSPEILKADRVISSKKDVKSLSRVVILHHRIMILRLFDVISPHRIMILRLFEVISHHRIVIFPEKDVIFETAAGKMVSNNMFHTNNL